MTRALFVLALLLSAIGGSCFDPHEPACAFSCASDGKCPASYVCASDNLCHRADSQGVCTLTSPGSPDAAADGAAD